MRPGTISPRILSVPLLALVLLSPASPLQAQSVNSSGHANITDVSGTTITSGDMVSGMLFAEPGTVQTFFCSAATGVRNAGILLAGDLRAHELQVVMRNPGEIVVNAEIQDDLLVLLMASQGHEAAGSAILAGLTPAGNQTPAQRQAAQELIRQLDGLLAVTESMDVYEPGSEGATRLSRTVGRFNALVNVSSEGFLRSPSQEFLAIQSILSRLVIAAMDFEDRPDGCGLELVLAPPPPPAEPPAPAPVPERAAMMCLLVDDQLREIAAIEIPSTGETFVVVNGERRLLTEVYRTGAEVYAPGNAFVQSDAPIEVRGRRYVRFGTSRAVQPSEVTGVAEWAGGIALFQPVGSATPPELIYVPVQDGCVVQPYALEEDVLQVRG
jgi:hypothetical protein